ncbi:MAG: DUF2723 domain-containing protein [Caldilineaceae bacterium]|nr:DUF2723 domain-containing protein [Caldilineaceae bacterium]
METVEGPLQNRTDRQIALLLFAGVFGLYVRTLAPGLLFGDSGEFQVAAWTLGLAHATGYPLYLLLGSLWQHLLALFGLSPAYALNLLSALFGALTVSLLYLTLLAWLQSTRGIRRLVALVAALFLALNPTFWSQSLIAEVYTLHAFFLLLILHLAYRLIGVRDEQRNTHAEGAEEEVLHQHTSVSATPATLVLVLMLVVGLSFTHHAMTLMVLPSLGIALWWSRPRWGANPRTWLLLPLALLTPLLLYLYLPLRSGPGPSPWYHQPLGDAPLTLYHNDWISFLAFVSGRSIAVGFRELSGAVAQLSQAWLLWRLHFFLPGLVLIVLGLYVLLRARNWPVLALTVPLFLLQQGFNLFYNIGDILVYYIPLYLVGTIWLAFAVDAIGGSMANVEQKVTEEERAADEQAQMAPAANWREKQRAKEKRPPALPLSALLVLTVFWLPFQLGQTYFSQLDQSAVTGARTLWDPIAQAAPPNAILISNDRNEIVPLFYYQAVAGKLTGVTGLFPGIAPDARFADIAATVSTALSTSRDRPVYLIKAMPGLAVRFDLTPATPPLVAVHERTAVQPTVAVNQPYGPLTLLGFDWQRHTENVVVTLYWQVDEQLAQDYTTTVQLLDGNGAKLAQDDAPPGGRYYPTSLWKVGEVLVEQHALALDAAAAPATLLVALYDRATVTNLAPPLELSFTATGVTQP